MQLHLKRRNRPTEPGFYLCCRVDHTQQPILARIDDDFTMVTVNSIFPLAKCESSTLWSDKLNINGLPASEGD